MPVANGNAPPPVWPIRGWGIDDPGLLRYNVPSIMETRRLLILALLVPVLASGCKEDAPSQSPARNTQPRRLDSTEKSSVRQAHDELLLARTIADIYGSIGEFFRHVSEFQLALPKLPRPDEERIKRSMAGAALRNGEFVRAAEYYRALAARNPEDLQALRGLATAFAALEQFDQAAAVYGHILAKNPEDTKVRYNLAVSLTRVGRLTLAERQFQQVLREDPSHGRARSNLGMLYIALKEYTSAVKHLEKAVQLLPDQVRLREALGESYMLTGRPREAMEQFSLQARMIPSDLMAWRNYSVAAFEAGSLGRAILATRKCLELTRIQGQTQQCLAQLACLQAEPRQPGGQVLLLARGLALVHAAQAPTTAEAAFLRDLGEIHWAIYQLHQKPEHKPLALQAWQESLQTVFQPDLARRIQTLTSQPGPR